MPILMSNKEWSRIVKWTNPDAEDPEVVKKREYVKFLDETSREMTKSWPNSVENVNKRNEELRRARIDAAEQANTIFYKRYLRKKQEKQEQLMLTARDIFFRNKDAPKQLLRAVIETAVQKERIEQIKFQNELRRQEAEEKRREDDEIIRKAKEWHALLELKKKRRFDVNKQHQKELAEQAHEVAERKRMEYEEELNRQKVDNILGDQQMEALAEFEENLKKEERQRIANDMARARQERAKAQREAAARDKMDDKLIEVLLKSRAKVDRRRKLTEEQTKKEKLRVLEAISKRLESGDAAREEKENQMLEKARKEREDAEDALRQARKDKQEMIRKERLESRRKFLEDEAQRVKDFNTRRQWEIMNRFKNAEVYEEFKENLRKEKARKIAEHRAEILRLWKERDDRDAAERAAIRRYYGPEAEQKLRDEQDKVFAHAKELLDEAKRHGRPDYELRRAIHRYCGQNKLYRLPDLPDSQQEHYGDFKPPCRSACYGLQEYLLPKKAEPAATTLPPTPPEKPKEEVVEDYKRQGRANGLQRRNLETTLSLPPITTVPCKTESCRCELKPK